MSPDLNRIIKKTAFMNFMIAVSMLSAILLYSYITYTSISQADPLKQSENAPVNVFIFYGMSLASLLVSKPIKEFIWNKTPSIHQASATTADLQKVIGRYTTGVISALAFCEVPALFGLILSFQTHALHHCFTLSILAFTAIVFHFPRKDHCELWIRSKIK